MDNSLSTADLDLKQLFPFELDGFQLKAIDALNAGKSVVVCAPTGSGKTLIGEYAIYRALARRKRVFYTTPLKALSNQKLRDFRDRFGADQVGLLTGDVSINRDAPIVVMTTEIFRNMLYGTPIGEVGISLQGLDVVVLDECHYMNDIQRGTVWEESIIYCPQGIQLVALSATIANSDQLTDWISQVHGSTELIYSDFRPVPLEFSFGTTKGLFPLLNSNHTGINPRLRTKGNPRNKEAPNLTYVVNQLWQRDMLPAIYFIFSRKGCERALEELDGVLATSNDFDLLTPFETDRLRSRVDEFLRLNPEAGRIRHVEPLYRGIAAHHAGILPAWKGLIEELFQQGLIKVVFATETLAAGINMPARTTVISSLSKRTDRGHRLLNASEFLQMSGRAGRRGMDEQGYVVTLQTRFEGAREAAYLATSGADPLVSQFTPSYGMVLNLLQTHTIQEARNLVERSFGQYLSTLYLKPQQQEVDRLEAELEHHEAQLAHISPDLLANYEKLNERLKEERRLLKLLNHQAQDMRSHELAMALSFAIAGTVLTLKGKHIPLPLPLPATLVHKAQGSGQSPYMLCLGQDNRWYVATVADVAGLYGEFPRIVAVDTLIPPADLVLKPGASRKGDETTAVVAQQIPNLAQDLDRPPEIQQQQERVAAVEAQIEAHPVHQWGAPANLLKRRKRLEKVQQELADRRHKLREQSERYWSEFLTLMEILQQFEGLEEVYDENDELVWKPTVLGQIAAAIRGDNELWLGVALASGELDTLDPHHLATACAALVTEVSRPDNWTHHTASPEVEAALNGLRGVRRQLIQLQYRRQVAIPVWLETDWSGLVERWALGDEWADVCSNTSLDEGDVVRILRRTLDFLSQIPHVPHLPLSLRQNAIRAIQLIDRFPVDEGVAK
ncbi:MAG: DEAD/DEAH box helicase [Leptolyngbyaceae cyanobacterium SL_7_1]|nr:DEAD/DEAH box helicase [Leptolyngbyaceae cyanobacterium SL_7_1]